MASEKEVLQSLYDAVLAYDSDAAVKAAETAVAIGIDPVTAIDCFNGISARLEMMA